MSWFRSLMIRWLGIPVDLKIQRFIFKGEPIDQFGPEHLEAWAKLWQAAPGLWDSWYKALGETIKEMAMTPAKDEFNGERIRLCQRAVDIWQNLQLASESQKALNAHYEKLQEQQERGVEQIASQNLM